MASFETSDSELLLALRAGDDTALNLLIARWQQPLFAFAWRYLRRHSDAQELVAETFVRLYQAREKLAPDTRLKSWLFTTLANLCHNHYRWRQRHPSVSMDEPLGEGGATMRETLSSEAINPQENLLGNERRDALHHALAQLPHDWKTALLLYHFEQLSYREIGAILGCSERGIETRIYRARQQLRELLSVWLSEPAKK